MSKESDFMPIGTMANVHKLQPHEYIGKIANFGLNCCQLGGIPDELLFGEKRSEHINQLKKACQELNVKITALWIPFPGQRWSFADAPLTVGLIPQETRCERMMRCCLVSDLAKELGIDLIAAHVGFIPEDPDDLVYKRFVKDFRYILEFCANNEQTFILETGQETAATLARFITDLNMPNVGVNFDPANLLIYNHDDPLDALDHLGKYIINVHCKDGCRPQCPGEMGREIVFGQGDIKATAVLEKLYKIGYRGPLIIEREIPENEEHQRDLKNTIKLIADIRNGFC